MTIRVTGLRETVRSLEAFADDAADLRDGLTRSGDLVAGEARDLARKRTGAMAGSIRPELAGKGKFLVRAGYPGMRHAGVQNYGSEARGISPNLYLQGALDHTERRVVGAMDDDLGRLIRRHDLT